MVSLTLPTIAMAAVPFVAPTFARPSGSWLPGGHVGGGPADGVLLAVEGGWGTMLAGGADAAQGAWTVGVRAGYAFARGLELHLRYDDLGVAPSSSRSPLQLATAGLRYSAPLPVMPFAEVDAGPAFALGDVFFGAGVGVGVTLPLVNHVLLDLGGHDWLVPISGTLRQTLGVGLALAVTFGGPR